MEKIINIIILITILLLELFGDIGPACGLIFYINPNYIEDSWRYLEAAPTDHWVYVKSSGP